VGGELGVGGMAVGGASRMEGERELRRGGNATELFHRPSRLIRVAWARAPDVFSFLSP
jgi:hypothetical protein